MKLGLFTAEYVCLDIISGIGLGGSDGHNRAVSNVILRNLHLTSYIRDPPTVQQ